MLSTAAVCVGQSLTRLLTKPVQTYTGLPVGVTHVNNICGVACRYLFIIDCTLNLMVFYGIMGVYVTADLSLANVLSSFFYGLWNLFTGFLIGVSQMAGWWKWL